MRDSLINRENGKGDDSLKKRTAGRISKRGNEWIAPTSKRFLCKRGKKIHKREARAETKAARGPRNISLSQSAFILFSRGPSFISMEIVTKRERERERESVCVTAVLSNGTWLSRRAGKSSCYAVESESRDTASMSLPFRTCLYMKST